MQTQGPEAGLERWILVGILVERRQTFLRAQLQCGTISRAEFRKHPSKTVTKVKLYLGDRPARENTELPVPCHPALFSTAGKTMHDRKKKHYYQSTSFGTGARRGAWTWLTHTLMRFRLSNILWPSPAPKSSSRVLAPPIPHRTKQTSN